MKEIMFISKIVIMLGFISLFSCNKSESNVHNTCEVIDPIEELSWLSSAIEDIKDDKYAYFSIGKMNEESVFFYDNCNPLINYASILLDCNGDRIGLKNDFLNELTEIRILWKHEKTLCN